MRKKNKDKPSEGLGDTVAKITELLNIDKLAQLVAETLNMEDCGCERRREKLNELFPYENKKQKED